MVTDEQVKRLRQFLAQGQKLCGAAARAEMTVKTARRWRSGPLPSQETRERAWRTREDCFADVWPWIEAELRRAPGLEAGTIFELLQERHTGRFQEGQLRTLQRRIRQWRATGGPGKEVMFAQVLDPGRQAQSDFTNMNARGITIGGVPFPHLLYHFQLPYSNWEYAEMAFSETFEALSQGFQNGVWTLGGVPSEHRTDNLSAATHRLKEEEEEDARKGKEPRGLTERYEALMRHYGAEATTNTPRRAHENGDVEQAHHRLDRAIEQALLVRGSRDFESRKEYEAFVERIVAKRNRARTERLATEIPRLRPLPGTRLDAWKEVWKRVGPGSTIRVDGNTYSVNSRLIGHEVSVRVYADLLEVRLGGTVVERLERLRGKDGHKIQYRHVIHSLVRKPGAFRGYRYREDLYPSVVFRQAYDALVERFGERGDGEYLRVLQLAATTSERDVATAPRAAPRGGRGPPSGCFAKSARTISRGCSRRFAAAVSDRAGGIDRSSICIGRGQSG